MAAMIERASSTPAVYPATCEILQMKPVSSTKMAIATGPVNGGLSWLSGLGDGAHLPGDRCGRPHQQGRCLRLAAHHGRLFDEGRDQGGDDAVRAHDPGDQIGHADDEIAGPLDMRPL